MLTVNENQLYDNDQLQRITNVNQIKTENYIIII